MSGGPPDVRSSLKRLLLTRWRAFGRCGAVHPDNTAKPLQCVQAPGHDGAHGAPMQVEW